MTLKGKRILLGITGGVAAYKAAALARLLVKAGADVRVAMTQSAMRFIGTATMQALSGQPVWTDLWDARVPDSMGHIELSRDRDLIVVAPITRTQRKIRWHVAVSPPEGGLVSER